MTLGPVMADLQGTELRPDERQRLLRPEVGGVILFRRNYRDPEQLRALVTDIHALRSPPLLVAVDQEGGRVQRFVDGFTRLPPLRALGRLHDTDPRGARQAARELGWLLAAELRCCGVDFSFAPVADLDHGVSRVIGDRALHADPDTVATLAQSLMHGMRDAGMVAVAKHFPGHGGAVADSHVAEAVDRREWGELLDDLHPFRRLIDAGLPAVMMAHVIYPAVSPEPAGFSSAWIREQLRGRMGFTGAVFSDDLSMQGAAAAGGPAARARAALEAGCDMLPVCNDPRATDAVLDELDGYLDPAAQVRLVRLRARQPLTRAQLHADPRYAAARTTVDELTAAPDLRLES